MTNEEKEKIRDNIAINYFVLYILWKKICPHGSFNIYDEWNITAQRFLRAKNEGHIKTGDICDNLPKRTGLSEKIFNGTKRIVTPIDAADKIWDEYLKALKSGSLAEIEKLRAEISNRLIPINFDLDTSYEENEWYTICYYFKFIASKGGSLKEKPIVSEQLEKLTDLIEKKLTLNNLQQTEDIELLKKMQGILKRKLELINALIIISNEETKQ